MEKIVVTGMGVVSPVGTGVPDYWPALCAGRSGIRAFEGLDDRFPSRIAGMITAPVVPEGMDPKELRRQSRYILFAVEAANQAWKQSGLSLEGRDPQRFGVNIGSGIGDIGEIHDNALLLERSGPRRVSPFFIPKALANMAAGIVAIRFGLRGPNRALVTACATGAQSLASAADSIRLGQADVMLAGGAEAAATPFSLASFGALRALSTRNEEPERASRPFDADRDGFVLAEGAGVLVLESESHARARGAEILAELAGYGETCDAFHAVAPRPDGSGCAASMRAALAMAGIAPEQVGYINAHGTRTKLNDIAESAAILSVFGPAGPLVSSTKSMTGHLLGAAGAVEAIACVQTLLTGVIHPSINYENPDIECPINIVSNTAREANIAFALSNSLGFGGHNASLVFKRHG
ncbi:MAG: beta-ketoacyl-ACP synthase II [Candidatus Hydrogenedens sp.]|nr:beta-ketoacyl-ACP synthase II [Candidatus Hydrogenedens sp.]